MKQGAALAAAHVLGVPLDHAALFHDRHTRPFGFAQVQAAVEPAQVAELGENRAGTCDMLERVRALVARRAELPLAAVRGDSRLLAAARRAAREKLPFLLVDRGSESAALAKTLFLDTTVVSFAATVSVDAVLEELARAVGYREARFSECRRQEADLALLPPSEVGVAPLGPEDLLLVSGGGKGFAADLARATGCALLLPGRSLPARDGKLSANQERFAAQGLRAAYRSANVSDAAAVQVAVTLSEADLDATLADKVGGFDHLLAAIDPIPPDAGLAMLRRLLSEKTPASLVVSGQLGELPTLRGRPPGFERRRPPCFGAISGRSAGNRRYPTLVRPRMPEETRLWPHRAVASHRLVQRWPSRAPWIVRGQLPRWPAARDTSLACQDASHMGVFPHMSAPAGKCRSRCRKS